jgi:hypothetical protein
VKTTGFLRLESVAIAVAALVAYNWQGGGLLFFVLLLFAPDLSAAGYLLGDQVGAFTYNLAHVYLWPLALVGLGLYLGEALAIRGGLVWLFHVGLDRSIGYGLKEGSFRDTHLGRIGRKDRG